MEKDFIDFILKDVNSKVLTDYVNETRDLIKNIKELVNNDKVSGIEAKMIIKDLLDELEKEKKDVSWWSRNYNND